MLFPLCVYVIFLKFSIMMRFRWVKLLILKYMVLVSFHDDVNYPIYIYISTEYYLMPFLHMRDNFKWNLYFRTEISFFVCVVLCNAYRKQSLVATIVIELWNRHCDLSFLHVDNFYFYLVLWLCPDVVFECIIKVHSFITDWKLLLLTVRSPFNL